MTLVKLVLQLGKKIQLSLSCKKYVRATTGEGSMDVNGLVSFNF